MKTKPFAVRVPLALALALERQAEKEAVTVADVIRRILAISQQNQKDQVLEKLLELEFQLKQLSRSQTQIIEKLSEFDIESGN